ncbi:glycosyltransferase family 2 protein [Halomonas sp. E19]|uniref:glycosyltransferase family 2 protein n=1 Tax=unclassified Halomonas TaxID=2609666 RepID=UPI004033FB7C
MNSIRPHGRTTVIITTYNDELATLEKAVASALEQSLLPAAVLVVDDGSNNSVAQQVVDKFLAESEVTLRCLKKRNGGPSSARNFGLENTTSEFVTFLDSDDELLPENLNNKEEVLQALPVNYFGVYGTYLKMPMNKLHSYQDADGLINTDQVGKEGGIPGGVHTYVFRTEALRAIGGFDEALVHNEDFDVIIRLAKAGWLCKGNVGPGFIRNYRDNSLTRNNNYQATYNNLLRFLDKAEENQYFSPHELKKRRKSCELRLAKSMRADGQERKKVAYHLTRAFHHSPPSRFKEWLAYLYGKCSL